MFVLREDDMKQPTPILISEAQRLTQRLRTLQADMAEAGEQRRKIWADLNERGITQRRIADACEVVEHTVYTELRKNRES